MGSVNTDTPSATLPYGSASRLRLVTVRSNIQHRADGHFVGFTHRYLRYSRSLVPNEYLKYELSIQYPLRWYAHQHILNGGNSAGAGPQTFISKRGLGFIALIPCPTTKTAWLTNTEATVGLNEQVTAVDSPTATIPSDGAMIKGGGTSQKNGAGTCNVKRYLRFVWARPTIQSPQAVSGTIHFD